MNVLGFLPALPSELLHFSIITIIIIIIDLHTHHFSDVKLQYCDSKYLKGLEHKNDKNLIFSL